ncbi:MAG: AbrB/MazE/SpoVT family DNA-binding domain-containing protein [Deltaproteobacteria bacterium]|nr:AbrB/MazE/SpoVT family DNA-binding domain-containing protein [Deltaproteobacteria bacterium]
MNSESTITERGQITLPKSLRDRFALKPGTKVKFEATSKGIVLSKATSVREAVEGVYGILKESADTDAYIESIRGKAE